MMKYDMIILGWWLGLFYLKYERGFGQFDDGLLFRLWY